MDFFNKKNLFQLVNDPALLALFGLNETEKMVMRLRVVDCCKYKDIATELNIKIQRAHQHYKSALEKMTGAILQILEERSKNQVQE